MQLRQQRALQHPRWLPRPPSSFRQHVVITVLTPGHCHIATVKYIYSTLWIQAERSDLKPASFNCQTPSAVESSTGHWFHIGSQPKLSSVQTKPRNLDLRTDTPQSCCQHRHPQNLEGRTKKLLSISLTRVPGTHTLILVGRHFVGQRAASRIQSKHWTQETMWLDHSVTEGRVILATRQLFLPLCYSGQHSKPHVERRYTAPFLHQLSTADLKTGLPRHWKTTQK